MPITLKSNQPLNYSDILHISEGARPSISLWRDRNDRSKVRGYIPTPTAIELFSSFASAISGSNSNNRVRYLYGPYGGGKSHLALVIQHLLRYGPTSIDLEPLWAKLRGYPEKGPQVIEAISRAWTTIQDSKGFLVVTLQADEGNFRQAMLRALSRAMEEEFEPEIVLELQPDTIYSAALAKIEQWHQNFPEQYHRFIQQPDSDQIVSGLQSFDHAAYFRFSEIHVQITGGAHFDPNTFSKTHEVYQKVAEKLKSKGYAGILLIHDEFGNYLERAIRDEVMGNASTGPFARSEGIEFQDFAEMCVESGDNQIHFLMCSHLAPGDYARRSRGDETSRQTWEKYFGRAQLTSITSLGFDKDIYQLLDGVIVQEPTQWEAFLEAGALKPLTDLSWDARRLDFFPAQIWSKIQVEKIIVHGCYPLHPVTLYALPRLSVRLGQNERTMFSFVSSDDPGSLMDFLNNSSNFIPENPPFLCVETLFDYFRYSLQSIRPKYKDWYDQAVYNAGGKDAPDLDIRLIKLITLWQVLKEDIVVKLNVERAGFALDMSLPEERSLLNQAIERLRQKEVFYVGKDGAINPYGTDKAGLEEEINDKLEQLGSNHRTGDFLRLKNGKLMSASLRTEAITPIAYQRDFGVARTFEADYVVQSDWIYAKPLRGISKSGQTNPWQYLQERLNEPDAPEGLVLYFLPQTQEELLAAQTALSKHLKHPRLLAVLPTAPLKGLSEKTLRLEVLLTLLHTENARTDESKLIRLQDKLNDTITELEELLNPVLQFSRGMRGAELFLNGIKLSEVLNNPADLENFIDKLLRQTYRYDVPIKDEVFGQRKGTGQATTARKDLLKDIFRFSALHNKSTFDYSDTSMNRRLLRVVLVAHNILRRESGEWILDRPVALGEDNLRMIWNDIADYFFSQDGVIKPVEPLITRLIEPPYGVYRQVLPIYMACTIRAQSGQLHFFRKDKPVSGELGGIIDEIFKKPEEFKVSWVRVRPEIRAFMTILLKALAPELSLSTAEITAEKVAVVAANYYVELSKSSKNTNRLPSAILELRAVIRKAGSIPPDQLVKQFADALKAQNKIDVCEGREEELADVAIQLQENLTQLQNVSANYRKEMIRHLQEGLVSLFVQETEQDSFELRSALSQFFISRDQAQLKQWSGIEKLGIGELVAWTNSQEGLTSLAEILANKWAEVPIDEWDDTKAERYKTNVDTVLNVLRMVNPAVTEEAAETAIEAEAVKNTSGATNPEAATSNGESKASGILSKIGEKFMAGPWSTRRVEHDNSGSTIKSDKDKMDGFQASPIADNTNSVNRVSEMKETYLTNPSNPTSFFAPGSPVSETSKPNNTLHQEQPSKSATTPAEKIRLQVAIGNKEVVYFVAPKKIPPELQETINKGIIGLLQEHSVFNTTGVTALTQTLYKMLDALQKQEQANKIKPSREALG